MATFFTDFSEYSDGAVLTDQDWTAEWYDASQLSSGEGLVARSDSAFSEGIYVDWTLPSDPVNDVHGTSWDNPPDVTDVEIVYLVKITATFVNAPYMTVRGAGSAGSESGYAFGGVPGFDFRIGKWPGDGSVPSEIATDQSSPWGFEEFWWVRGRANGSDFKMKFWQDGNSEPSSWDLTATDSTYSSSGWMGIAGNASQQWDRVGFATNGDTAPKQPLPDPPTAPSNLQLSEQ